MIQTEIKEINKIEVIYGFGFSGYIKHYTFKKNGFKGYVLNVVFLFFRFNFGYYETFK